MTKTHPIYPSVDPSPNFPALEENVLSFWHEQKVFERSVTQRTAVNPDGTNNAYVFYDGPPFANGLPHYGHLLTGYVKDAIARYHTMRGRRVERRFGWDCHGLPAEMGAEKELNITGRAAIMEYGIDRFNDYCRNNVMRYVADWEYYVSRQGRWVDFRNDYKTMDTNFMESVIWAFSELYKKELVYEAFRVMPYSWAAETPLSNFETRMDNATRPREDKAAYVKFKLKKKPHGAPEAENYYLIAWTTTPWTLPSNLALAVNGEMEYTAIITHDPSPASGGSNPRQRIGGGVGELSDSTRNPESLARAEELRKNPTEAEKRLWQILSDKKLADKKFRRQHAIGPYIVDFACTTANLVIELDGGQHTEQLAYDEARTRYLNAQHYRVMRFWNHEVMENIEGVAAKIEEAMQHPPESADADSIPRKQGMGASCYFVASSATEKMAEVLKGEVVQTVSGNAFFGLTYEPLFPYFADTKNAFRVLDGSDFVTEGDGTGIVHMAPGFGEADQKCCAENGIDVVVPVDGQGKFTDAIYDLSDLALRGLTVVADPRITLSSIEVDEEDAARHIDVKDIHKFGLANMRILRWLKAHGKLVKDDVIAHNYPHCWRTDTPVIYRAMSSWYVAVTKFRDRAVELNQQIHWIPEHVKNGQMGHMLATAPDWSISRNRFWGTPIPIWRAPSGKVIVPGSIKEIETLSRHAVSDLHRPMIDAITFERDGETYTRVEDVFDCWFESGSMPYAQLHYPFENKQLFDENFPADFITEYVGQTRGWFNTLIMLSTALFDKPPFENCICHGVVIDEETGLKYSKRLKNYKDPKEVMDTYGADALRWMMLASPVMRGADIGVDPEGKFIRDVVRLNIKPLWSAYYFFTLYANADGVKATSSRACPGISRNALLSQPQQIPGQARDDEHLLDRYILAKAKAMVEQVRGSMDAYDTPGAADAVTGFLEVLNNWYIRRSRERFWEEGTTPDKQSAYDTLFTVLNLVCLCAAPLLPFTAEEVYRGLNGGASSVHLADFPDVSGIDSALELVADMDRVRDVCNAALAIRNKLNIRVRQPLSELRLEGVHASTVVAFAQDIIKDEVNVKKLYSANTDFSEFATFKVSLNNAVLGKRLPEKMKQIIPAAKKGDYRPMPHNAIEICGEILRPNEFSMIFDPKPEFKGRAQALSTNDALVILDTVITPELEAEGRARDLVRMIQQARKDAGLHVADRITLALDVPEEFKAALAAHRGYIAEQTLALTIEEGTANAAQKLTQELDGAQFTIGITKAA